MSVQQVKRTASVENDDEEEEEIPFQELIWLHTKAERLPSTNPLKPPTALRSPLCMLRVLAVRQRLSDSVTRRCPSKSPSPLAENLSVLATSVPPPKISPLPDTGVARLGKK
jgi:hypothetical protein